VRLGLIKPKEELSELGERGKTQDKDKVTEEVSQMKRVHCLSDEETQALKQLYRSTKASDVRSRCEMILLSNEGLSPPKSGERVRFSGRTVRRYLDRYETDGMAGLCNKARPGRPPRVTLAYVKQLGELVEQFPRDLGNPFSNWTTENLAVYLAEQTGIVIGARQVENYLKANEWRLRRPVRTVKHKQDKQQVEEKKTTAGVATTGAR
jgi:transposase